MKSLLEVPVSLENFTVSTNVVGAVKSIVTVKPVDKLLSLPARSVALIFTTCTPSVMAFRLSTVILQLPLPSAPMVPSSLVPFVSYSVMVALASAVPEKVGVAVLVISSELELPESLPLVISGAPGVVGAVVSTTKVLLAETVVFSLPATSYSLTVIAYVPSVRPLSELLQLPEPSTTATVGASIPLLSST